MMSESEQVAILDNAEILLSPNHDERPDGIEISLIVIHCISLPEGQFNNSNVKDFFSNKLSDEQFHQYAIHPLGLKVSSHLFIDRAGKVTQFVPFAKRAWHAGVSEFQGRADCNDFSIGIELEGCDTMPFTEKQYQCLHTIVKKLQTDYPKITLDNIVGHSDIAPGRKTDPGPYFDWNTFKRMLKICDSW